MMQINDVNRAWLRERYGIEDLMNPYQNINAGTAMLGELKTKYGIHRAMMAYQYGEAGMARKVAKGVTTSTATENAYKQRDLYKQIIAPLREQAKAPEKGPFFVTIGRLRHILK
jgi:soluble lytic murein transglycosylase-like protein